MAPGTTAGKSGIVPLLTGEEAFAARLALVDAATRSLDLQYYLWHDDTTGRLLLDAVCRAAGRGVRVRLLLDDNNTKGLDRRLAALAAHDNIEVRLFNPFRHRRLRLLGYLRDFSRLNHRMHNKSLTADGALTVVGGRNVGDEYFGFDVPVGFADLDVLAGGAVVREVVRSFDEYWDSPPARPLHEVVRPADPAEVRELLRLCGQAVAAPASQRYLDDLPAAIGRLQQLRSGDSAEWTDVQLMVDPPVKAMGRAGGRQLLAWRLQQVMGQARQALDIVSPYFVPTRSGTRFLAGLARRGVRIRVLTNALESTDVAAVHAGYAKRRRALLRAGIALWELKRTAGQPHVRGRRFGRSGSSLHAKTFAADGEWIFIGSFNFDPRSAALNTELGFIIRSAALSRGLAKLLDEDVAQAAYAVELRGAGLQWTELRDGQTRRSRHEPHAPLGKRLLVKLLSGLPIEWLL